MSEYTPEEVEHMKNILKELSKFLQSDTGRKIAQDCSGWTYCAHDINTPTVIIEASVKKYDKPVIAYYDGTQPEDKRFSFQKIYR